MQDVEIQSALKTNKSVLNMQAQTTDFYLLLPNYNKGYYSAEQGSEKLPNFKKLSQLLRFCDKNGYNLI